MSDTTSPSPDLPSDRPSGLDPELVDETLELFASMRNSLQRWHDAYRRMHGGPAADPSRGQGRVLALLNMQGEMRQRDMGFILNIRPQSLGEVLGKLERAGLVTRRISEKDRRVLLVSITERGRSFVRNHKPSIPFSDLTNEELIQFTGTLSRIVDAFDRDTARLNAMEPPCADKEPADRPA